MQTKINAPLHSFSPYEMAVHDAKYSGLRQVMVTDTFEVLDILKTLTKLGAPVQGLYTGIDIIRWLDRNVGKDAHLCFIKDGIYFILLKFNGQEDGGLLLIMSATVQPLLDLFTHMQMTTFQQEILLWLIDN